MYIWGRRGPGITYLLGEEMPGKVTSFSDWSRLPRYLMSMGKNSGCYAVLLSARGPQWGVMVIWPRAGRDRWEQIHSCHSQISKIPRVWAHSASPVIMPAGSVDPRAVQRSTQEVHLGAVKIWHGGISSKWNGSDLILRTAYELLKVVIKHIFGSK